MILLEEYKSRSEQDTAAFAGKLASLLKSGDVALLEGSLGSGKTFLVKAFCRYIKTEDEASSPSFAIIQQYKGKQPVNHMDFYRINDERELDNLGWEEYLYHNAVTFIEWPQIIEDRLDSFYKIKISGNGNNRDITLYKTES
ncbi:MAG: tRNA (adenosine(37)-N6)-threonylcarbamoyltransferase complex ATPase subunit type 1 TsaE [Calditrichaceae bacterium]|nr:tRNA (adenosine(37)-N6)-threonylcarbamoyltransferase complex ATPase subunit type 1 TsaE [Calditrichaceae bacterium]MBN2709522.1 tRNA (adenosine(37)-N6)-threonylcarbamoyltransferase complex ATPase subunit type 1 TsaE [Calditrichaceae bacterium]RQV93130.1 MAG: tRNA (adenosine(37)-N6)-threonylcarbamoyltransferase complex ATPase subunit type 1 TsaE [Calditrichota bacterium]